MDIVKISLNAREGARGLGRQCGFPVGALKRMKEKALRARMSYIVVAEDGYYHGGLKMRVVTEKVTFDDFATSCHSRLLLDCHSGLSGTSLLKTIPDKPE